MTSTGTPCCSAIEHTTAEILRGAVAVRTGLCIAEEDLCEASVGEERHGRDVSLVVTSAGELLAGPAVRQSFTDGAHRSTFRAAALMASAAAF